MPVASGTRGAVAEPSAATAIANGCPPVKIVTMLYGFAPGGVERIAARLHAAWVDLGVRSEIVVADSRTPPPLALSYVTRAGNRSHSRGLIAFALLVLALRRRVRDDRPDAVFCAGNTYTSVAVMLRLLVGPTCPPIIAKISNCLVRNDMPPLLRWFYRAWLRLQGRWIDHFVGLAPAMRDEIAGVIGVPHDRISVIEDPALGADDLERLASLRDTSARDRRGRHYLAVGRLAPQKNFSLLIDAFARFSTPNDQLTILGEGAERAMLEAKAWSLGIAGRVRLPGHVATTEAWLADADALVLSSDYEGVPAVLIEALAAGIPIVSTRCCVSMDDLLGHGAYGRIVPVGDPAALAEAMAVAVLPEPASVIAARRTAAAQCTVDRASVLYIALVRQLTEARSVDMSRETLAIYPAPVATAAR
jgi:glycosyltransferase involved in cell wall biosynthesis